MPKKSKPQAVKPSGESTFNSDAYFMLVGYLAGGFFTEAKVIVEQNPSFLENRFRQALGVDGRTTIVPILETCIAQQNLPALQWCIEQGAQFFKSSTPELPLEEGVLRRETLGEKSAYEWQKVYEWQSSTVEQAMGAGVPFLKALVDAYGQAVLDVPVDTIKMEMSLGRAIRLAKADTVAYILSVRPELLHKPVDGMGLQTFKSPLFYCRHRIREAQRIKNVNSWLVQQLRQMEDLMLSMLSKEKALTALHEIQADSNSGASRTAKGQRSKP